MTSCRTRCRLPGPRRYTCVATAREPSRKIFPRLVPAAKVLPGVASADRLVAPVGTSGSSPCCCPTRSPLLDDICPVRKGNWGLAQSAITPHSDSGSATGPHQPSPQ